MGGGGQIPSACIESHVNQDDLWWRIRKISALSSTYSIQHSQNLLWLTVANGVPQFYYRSTLSNWLINPVGGYSPWLSASPKPSTSSSWRSSWLSVPVSTRSGWSVGTRSGERVRQYLPKRFPRLRPSEKRSLAEELRNGGHGSKSIAAFVDAVETDLENQAGKQAVKVPIAPVANCSRAFGIENSIILHSDSMPVSGRFSGRHSLERAGTAPRLLGKGHLNQRKVPPCLDRANEVRTALQTLELPSDDTPSGSDAMQKDIPKSVSIREPSCAQPSSGEEPIEDSKKKKKDKQKEKKELAETDAGNDE